MIKPNLNTRNSFVVAVWSTAYLRLPTFIVKINCCLISYYQKIEGRIIIEKEYPCYPKSIILTYHGSGLQNFIPIHMVFLLLILENVGLTSIFL